MHVGKIEISGACFAQSAESIPKMMSFEQNLSVVSCCVGHQTDAFAATCDEDEMDVMSSSSFLEEEGATPTSDDEGAQLLSTPVRSMPQPFQASLSDVEEARMMHRDSSTALAVESRNFASLMDEKVAALAELPMCLTRLSELDPEITTEMSKLTAFKAKLALGHTYGKGIDELLEPQVAVQRAAFDAALAEQAAAGDGMRAVARLQANNIPQPKPGRGPAADARFEAHRLAIAAERQRVQNIKDAAGERVGSSRLAANAAKEALDAAKAFELPLLESKLMKQIETLEFEGNMTAKRATLLMKALLPLICSARDQIELEKVVAIDTILLKAAEKREEFGGMVTICVKTREVKKYDDDGDLITDATVPKEELPKPLDFSPSHLHISNWTDVCALAGEEAAFARLYPSGPNVPALLRQMEKIRTRPAVVHAVEVQKTVEMPAKPVIRELLGANGLVASKLTVDGIKTISLQSTNACNRGIGCRNAFCRYTHPMGRDEAIQKEQAERKEAQDEWLAENEATNSTPSASGSGRMTRAEKSDDKLTKFVNAISLCTSSTAFAALEKSGIEDTNGCTIAKGMCIAKVVLVPGGTRLRIILLDGSASECICKGMSIKVNDFVLLQDGMVRATISGKSLQTIQEKLVELQVTFDTMFFGHSVDGAVLDDLFDFGDESEEKVAAVVPHATRLMEHGLPAYLLPPTEDDETEEADEDDEEEVNNAPTLAVSDADPERAAILAARAERKADKAEHRQAKEQSKSKAASKSKRK